MNCNNCPLEGYKQLKGFGSREAPVVIVTDAVSLYDSAKGRMFSDNPGKLIMEVLRGAGVKNPYMTSAVKCGINNPDYVILRGCQPNLQEELKTLKPKVIITLGSNAYAMVANGYTDIPIMAKAEIEWHEDLNCYVKPTLHPDYILYRPSLFRDYIATFEQMEEIIKLPPRQGWYVAPTKREIISTMSRAKELVHYLVEEKKGIQHNDFETNNFSSLLGGVIAHGISADAGLAYIFSKEICMEKTEEYWQLMQYYFTSLEVQHGWQNGKFDIQFAYAMGVEAKVDHDLMLCHYCIDERKGTHSLDDIAMRYLHVHDWEAPLREWKKQYMAHNKIKAVEFSYDLFPDDMLYEYLGYDADYTGRSFDYLYPIMLNTGNVQNIYHNWLTPASNELAKMEFEGAPVDMIQQGKMQIKYRTKLDELEAIFAHEVSLSGWTPSRYAADTGAKSIPDEFNPRSSKQMQHLLFDILHMPLYRGQRKTDKKAIRYIIEKTGSQPVLEALQQQRKAAKLFSTYIVGMKENAIFGNIHSPFKLHGTETGRISSGAEDDAEEEDTSFNLQNIPRLPEIRDMIYCPTPWYLMLEGDYSQAELRTLAVITQDPFLMDIFYTGKDIHDEVSLKIWGINYTSEDRVKAKAINFGIVYGITAFSLSADLSTQEKKYSVKEAQGWIDAWLDPMPKVRAWLNKQKQDVVKGNVCETVFGRRRYWGLVTSEKLRHIQNEACNTPIQATASDLTLRALIEFGPQVRASGLKGKPFLTVHDCIISNVFWKHIVQYAMMQKEKMEILPSRLLNTDLPFIADFKVGLNWGSLSHFNPEEESVTKKILGPDGKPLKNENGKDKTQTMSLEDFVKEVIIA